MSNIEVSNVTFGDASDLRTALVTGATGLLGQAVVRALSANGWKLATTARSTAALTSIVSTLSSEAEIIAGDLTKDGEGARVAQQAIDKLGSVHLLIHLASPPVQPAKLLEAPSDLHAQFAVNASAFLEMSSVLLPGMLRRQTGTIVATLSQALLPPIPAGWQSYTIAKAAQAQAAADIASAYGKAGIRVIGIVPDLIAPVEDRTGAAPTASDAALSNAVSAETVATQLIAAAIDENIPSGTAISIDRHGTNSGRLSLSLGNQDQAAGASAGKESGDQARQLAQIIRRVFRLVDDEPVEDGAIGVLAGWDSLGHIKLIMEVEETFGVSFDAQESTEITSFARLSEALKRHGIE